MNPADAFDALVQHRRAVRIFDADADFDPEVVSRSLARAVLSPNSSNLQMWEFHRVQSPELLEQFKSFCLGQSAAKTANELVVVAVRHDLWKQRCRAVLQQQAALFREKFGDELSPTQRRVLLYWEKVVPSLYRSALGLFDAGKWLVSRLVWLVRPISLQVTSRDMRVSAHRSVALAAMTFMWSLAAEGYDSCPMEGHDSGRIKKALGLPRGAEISMVIAVGSRTDAGIYGPRLRLPLEDVIRVH